MKKENAVSPGGPNDPKDPKNSCTNHINCCQKPWEQEKNTCPNPSVHSKPICPDLTVHDKGFWDTNTGKWIKDGLKKVLMCLKI
jgi:hypothetical protein